MLTCTGTGCLPHPGALCQAFREDESVCIHAHDGGFNVGWNTKGEYLMYTIDVTGDGARPNYAVAFHCSSFALGRVSHMIGAWLCCRLSATAAAVCRFAQQASRYTTVTLSSKHTMPDRFYAVNARNGRRVLYELHSGCDRAPGDDG